MTASTSSAAFAAKLNWYQTLLTVTIMSKFPGDKYQVILEVVGKFCHFTVDELVSMRRPADLCAARHLAMFICWHWGLGSLNQIKVKFRRTNHATVLHGHRKFAELLETDHLWEERLIDCLNEIAKRMAPPTAPA